MDTKSSNAEATALAKRIAEEGVANSGMQEKLEDDGRCKYLKFAASDAPDETSFLGCIGSLGSLRKLYFIDGDGDYARFVLYTGEGVYGLEPDAYEPGFMTMRFLSVIPDNYAPFFRIPNPK